MNKPYLYIARAWASRYHGHVTSPTSEHVSVRHVTRVFSIFGGGGGGGRPLFHGHPAVPYCRGLVANPASHRSQWWILFIHRRRWGWFGEITAMAAFSLSQRSS